MSLVPLTTLGPEKCSRFRYVYMLVLSQAIALPICVFSTYVIQ